MAGPTHDSFSLISELESTRSRFNHLQKHHLFTPRRSLVSDKLDDDKNIDTPIVYDDDEKWNVAFILKNLQNNDEIYTKSDSEVSFHQLEEEMLQSYPSSIIPVPQTQLENIKKIEEIIWMIDRFVSQPMAARLTYLHQLPVDDDYEDPINLESVKGFALFIMNKPSLPYPQIGANPDGCVHAEWEGPSYGTVILEFLSSNFIQFTVIRPRSAPQHPRVYYTGVAPLEDVVQKIELDMRRLAQ